MKFDATVFLLDLQICHLIFKSLFFFIIFALFQWWNDAPCVCFKSFNVSAFHFTLTSSFYCLSCVSKYWRKCEKHFISQDRLWCKHRILPMNTMNAAHKSSFYRNIILSCQLFRKAIILICSAVILKGSYEPINIFFLFRPTQTVCL